MRKVCLRSKELFDYEHIKNYVDHGGNIAALALKLNCSERTVRRKIAGYKTHGKAFFIHGNRERAPVTKTPAHIARQIIELYFSDAYADANFKHFHELLGRYHPELTTISLSGLRKLFKDADILSPKAHRATKRAYRKKIEAVAAERPYDAPLPLQKDPHPRREKSRYMGELIFMDASFHDWFETGSACSIHAAIDDASGTVVGAFAAEQETLHGYYQVSAQMLRKHGIPHKIQTDGRSVFEYAAFSRPKIEKDHFTQFGYACKTLGIELDTTSCAQAQGKIERLFETWQSRLVVEFRMHGIRTTKEANKFLLTYLPQYNAQFAAPLHSNRNAFELPLSETEINLTLAVLSTRVVDTGCAIRYDNTFYRFLDDDGTPVPLKHKTAVTVIKALEGKLYASCQDKVFALDQIHDHVHASPRIDAPLPSPPAKKNKIYIPSMNHPWRYEVLTAFQEKNWDQFYSFEEVCYTTAFVRGN